MSPPVTTGPPSSALASRVHVGHGITAFVIAAAIAIGLMLATSGSDNNRLAIDRSGATPAVSGAASSEGAFPLEYSDPSVVKGARGRFPH